MTNTAVLVPGTSYILPVNLVKGTQQFTIVFSGSKLLATVPGMRAATGGSASNALVLKSFINESEQIIAQPGHMKQVKIPNLQTITTTTNQSQHSSILQTSTTSKVSDSTNTKSKSSELERSQSEEQTTSTILVNKSSAINIIQR